MSWAASAFVAAVVLSVTPAATKAQEEPAPVPWREVWSGADVTANTWLVYSGVTIAPFSHIHDDGLRIRFTTGYGQYKYTGFRRPLAGGAGPGSNRNFAATTGYGDLLIGYLKRFGPLTAKAFVGAAYISHSISPIDPQNVVQGADWGVKGGLEFWLNIGDDAWASLDGHWTSAHDTFSVRSRLGYRILPTLSLGPEAGVNGNAQQNQFTGGQLMDLRGGLFARYEWAGGELSAAAGIAGDIAEPTTPYGTVNWMTLF